ncbi:MAG: hypothetical protein ACK41D_03025 [Rubricoccaceae bacterium]
MTPPRRALWGPAAAYAAVCAALWPVPVFGVLHAESSAVVGGAAFFVAGLSGVGAFRRGEPLGRVTQRHVALLGVPLALLTLSLLWRPNCGYALGLLLFGVLAVPSAPLGVAAAWALAARGGRFAGALLVAGGVLVGLSGVAFDLLLHPQFFTYNHVFGGVLGPIYDEELAIRPGLFVFRALTVLWTLGLVLLGTALRRPPARRRPIWLALSLVGVLLALAYALRVPLGLNQSEASLARALGATVRSGPFVIHYDPARTSATRLAQVVEEHHFRYARLAADLGTAPPGPFLTFLYPDPDARGRLVGARETSVAPVWRRPAQMHLLDAAFDASFGHELAHAFSQSFGHPVTGATWAIGLVEGLAVALEPPDGLPAPEQQVAAALRLDADASGGVSEDLSAALARTMQPLGFWSGRAGVSYTTAGAFVRWLLDRYGPEPLRAAYRTGSFSPYGRSLEALAEEWAAHVRTVPVTAEAAAVAAWRFGAPSLFEVRCPHHVPRHVRLTRAGQAAVRAGDAAAARAAFAAARARAPGHEPALLGLAALDLAEGARPPAAVAADLKPEAFPASPARWQALGDARRLAGTPSADSAYAAALGALPPYASAARARLALRAALGPEALRPLLAVPSDSAALQSRAARLGVWPDPAAQVLAALLEAEAGAFEQAFGRLARYRGAATRRVAAGERAGVARFLTAQAAGMAYRAGRLREAERLAAQAEAAYRAVGAEGPAEVVRDLRTRIAWRAAANPPGE